MRIDSYTSPDAEELLRSAAERHSGPTIDRRALVTEAWGAALFLIAAGLIAGLAHPARAFSLPALLVTVVAFIVAALVHFPVGAGWTRPTEIVLVPMLFALPVTLVPFVVMGCLLLEYAPRVFRGQRSPIPPLTLLGDSAYALGPVLVLVLLGGQRFAWSHWPVYALAFVAQTAIDLGSGLTRMWFAERMRPNAQGLKLAYVYASDACLASAGLLIAGAAVARPALILLALPLVGLFGLFARERSERMENTLALSTAYRGTALLLGDVIEDDDEYTGLHSRAVVDLSLAVAERLGLDPTARRDVEFGALLHDVGKIRVPKAIINKPGKLDDAEWAIMREHTVFGEQMLRQVGGTLSSVGRVVRHSHERWDGTGYPDGLAGEGIPIEARIVCACDAFNAMTTHRPYRHAMPLKAAVAELTRCAGSHFDPQIVYALLAEIAEHPQVIGPVAPAEPPPTPMPSRHPAAQAGTGASPELSVSAAASA